MINLPVLFPFFQSLSTWRRLGAEPLTPLCPLKQSTTSVRSEWRRSWSEHARAHARRHLCRHRTTRETPCLFCQKYTGACQIQTNSKQHNKQHSNAMSQKVSLFLFEFFCFWILGVVISSRNSSFYITKQWWFGILFSFSKRSLARLGETHCSHCHPERETSLALGKCAILFVAFFVFSSLLK